MCRKSRQKYLADSLFSKRFGLESYEWQLRISPSPSPPPLSQNRCGLTPPLFRTFSDQKALPFTKNPSFSIQIFVTCNVQVIFLTFSIFFDNLAICSWFVKYFPFFAILHNMQVIVFLFLISILFDDLAMCRWSRKRWQGSVLRLSLLRSSSLCKLPLSLAEVDNIGNQRWWWWYL